VSSHGSGSNSFRDDRDERASAGDAALARRASQKLAFEAGYEAGAKAFGRYEPSQAFEEWWRQICEGQRGR